MSAAQRIDLSSATVLITGGARGIGAATVNKLITLGARVAVFDRDVAGHELRSYDRLLILAGDVCDREAVEIAVARVVEHFGSLDVVIANAGITPAPGTIRRTDPEQFDRVIAVNFGGVLNVVRASADELVRSGGHVLLVSSCAAFTPGMGGAAYMVSKAAVEQLGRALRIELAAVGTSAGVAYFGVVDTELARATLDNDPIGERIGAQLPWPLNRRLAADAAADVLITAVRRRSARVIAPRSWLPYFWLRGVLNPLLEARLVKDATVHEIIRDLERA
ncbi:SDR family NAD(P)-dependent oxidoreductase [Williamsia sp. 1135]|uniref:SDR family NAD(P)-dependent oxidoreductase n=1 Tax=Williamsia sp. 1135 TaxID=1889262 RepID=UPI000A1122D6|nr:SDR family NAD(P)-dependent oxidoreductase [Williamsia sp. 1135]ORM27729.1 short-chain dehydrogenase [Williamsia sp. 1135]